MKKLRKDFSENLLTNEKCGVIMNVPNGSITIERHFMRSRDDSLFGKIVDYVNAYFEENGRSPSTREIDKGVGVSRATVQRYLTALQER